MAYLKIDGRNDLDKRAVKVMYKIEDGIPIPKYTERKKFIKRESNPVTDGMKWCGTCGIIKFLSEFNKDKSSNDGYQGKCRNCEKEYKKDNKERIKSWSKEYSKTEKGKIVFKKAQVKFRKTEKGKISARKSSAKKRSTPKGRINDAVSTGIGFALKNNKNGKHWENIVGYTLKELMDHLENQFESWMLWSNYGRKKGDWSIDHILPISSFNFSSYEDEEFKECWSLSNLRPLDHIENMKKHAKIL